MHCAQKISGPAKVKMPPQRIKIHPSARDIILKSGLGHDHSLGDLSIINKLPKLQDCRSPTFQARKIPMSLRRLVDRARTTLCRNNILGEYVTLKQKGGGGLKWPR